MISTSLLVLAAIFKSIADTLYHHYDTSVFKKLNPAWWNPVVSCNVVKLIRFTKYRPDAWHLANSAMIILFIAALVLYRPLLPWLPWWIKIIIGGLLFNIVFELFYSKLLRGRKFFS